ncbi:hypothetical protein J2T26_000694 [Citrobacter farmeri]|nr:hypothetical protein [Citrobacter farmeri]MCW2421481.1 hypothetical protein [Citrobacter farmeri]
MQTKRVARNARLAGAMRPEGEMTSVTIHTAG